MAWIRSKIILFVVGFFAAVQPASAQESLWKTFNESAAQSVPSYSGALSPFPQRQKKVEELEFETVNEYNTIEEIDADEDLTEQEKKVMLTASILAEIKAFLSEESMFIPNLDGLVVEATAKANGETKALIKGRWLTKGDELVVPVDEAKEALDLLERLRSVDEHLADTVENAVLDRAEGRGQETIKIVYLQEDQIVLHDTTGQEYVLNFIKAPF